MVDGILLSAGLVHVETVDLPRAFARMAEVVRPGGLVLASIREGSGKLDEWSLREIDGEQYDRNFIAHTPDEVIGAAEGLLDGATAILSRFPSSSTADSTA